MGFPTRVSRNALGSKNLRDRFPVRDPDTAISADIYKLLFWQVAGVNVTAPLAWAEIVVDGAGDVTLGASAEAWDADGVLLPVLSKEGTGLYRLTYDATYLDENNEAVVTVLQMVDPSVQDITALWHARGKAAANVVDVQVWNAAGAAADPLNQSVFVPVW